MTQPDLLAALKRAEYALNTAEQVFAEQGKELKEVTRGLRQIRDIIAKAESK